MNRIVINERKLMKGSSIKIEVKLIRSIRSRLGWRLLIAAARLIGFGNIKLFVEM